MKVRNLIVFSLALLLIIFPMNILADDGISSEDRNNNYQEVYGESNVYETQSRDVVLLAVVGSSYTVSLPKDGNMSDVDTTYEITVSEDGNGDLIVKVYKDGKELTSEGEGDETILLDISNEKADFYQADLEDEYVPNGSGSTTVTIKHDELTDGIWSGKMPISISLSNIDNTIEGGN